MSKQLLSHSVHSYKQMQQQQHHADRCSHFSQPQGLADTLRLFVSELYLDRDGLLRHWDGQYFDAGYEVNLRVPVTTPEQTDNSFALLPVQNANQEAFALCAQPGVELDLSETNIRDPSTFQQRVDEFAGRIAAQLPAGTNISDYLATQTCVLHRKLGDSHEIHTAQWAMPRVQAADSTSNGHKLINQAIADGPRFACSFKLPITPSAMSRIGKSFREARDDAVSLGVNAENLDAFDQACDDDTYFHRVLNELGQVRSTHLAHVQRMKRNQKKQSTSQSTFVFRDDDFPSLC